MFFVDRFIAAAIQLCVGSDKGVNLATAEELVCTAARRGARLIALPELFFWGGGRDAELSAAESIPGPTTTALSGLARELGVYLVGGSILEKVDGLDKVYNSCATFDPSGAMIATYRKVHLFDVEIGDRVAVRESATRAAGAEPVIVSCDFATLGLAICYDLRFPELFRRLVDQRATVVCMPSAFTFTTGAAHWEPLLRARAIENQVYVIAPNQHGRGASGVLNYGHSMIVDPWGTVLASAGDGDGVILADIDLNYLERVRREIPCLDHRLLRG